MSNKLEPPADEGGYWLPEDYELRLNAMELGVLSMLIWDHAPDTPVNRRGRDGEPRLSSMKAVLLEKILACAGRRRPPEKTP